MRKIGMDELRQKQMEVLDYVAALCDENGIRYWIEGGTLLGAIRHKGYICSKASVTENRIDRVISVLDKHLTTQQFVQPAVAVGDGDNDADFSKGLTGARTYVVALDGDLLVRPDDLEWVLNAEEEVIGGTTPSTDNPVLMTLDREHRVIEFSRERGQLEWTGLAKMRTDRLTPGIGHVYQLMEPLLPIRAVEIHTKEIDTVNDYENAVKWVRNHYRDAE